MPFSLTRFPKGNFLYFEFERITKNTLVNAIGTEMMQGWGLLFNYLELVIRWFLRLIVKQNKLDSQVEDLLQFVLCLIQWLYLDLRTHASIPYNITIKFHHHASKYEADSKDKALFTTWSQTKHVFDLLWDVFSLGLQCRYQSLCFSLVFFFWLLFLVVKYCFIPSLEGCF